MNILFNTNNFYVKKIGVSSQTPARPAFKARLKNDTFERTSAPERKTPFGVIRYTKEKRFSELEFAKPLSLEEAMKTIYNAQDAYKLCNYGIATSGFTLREFADTFSLRFQNMKFTKFLGAGYNALALENEDGKVVKMCENDHFILRRGEEDFDAHVFRKGHIRKQHFYYIQEKCTVDGVTEKHVHQMEEKIRKKGYVPDDMYEGQVGFSKDGKLCLIDPECAIDPQLKEERRILEAEWQRAFL